MWWKKLYARLNKKYRVQFIDHDSLYQSRLWIIKPGYLAILFVVFIFLVIAGTASLIVYTPIIRERIPGYLNPELEQAYHAQQEEVLALQGQVEQLDSVLASMLRSLGVDRNNFENINFEDYIAEANNIANNNEYDYSPPPEENNYQPEANPNYPPPVRMGDSSGEASPTSPLFNLVVPVKGIVTNHFNGKSGNELHFGIDIVANENSIIKSVSEGYVIFSEYSNQTGYVIGISHPELNLVSFYKHNSQVYKKIGSYVYAGEPIAVIGNSGENSTGPHLHFELWSGGKPVNPAQYVIFN